MQSFIKKHRYIILISGAVIQIFTGIPAAWGVFQQSVCEDYNISAANGTMIFSFTICAFGVGSIIGGFLQDKKGPRFAGILGSILLAGGFLLTSLMPQNSAWILYCSFSLPVGLGNAFLYPAVMSCAQKWYSDKKGFATGIIGIAVGLSGAILTLFVKILSQYGNIRLTFIALGIIIIFVCGFSCVFLENPKQSNCNNKKLIKHKPCKNEFSPLTMLKTRQYWFLTLAILCAAPSMILFSPIIVEIGTSRGLSQNLALSCVAIASFFSAAGRLAMPWLSDKISKKSTFILLYGLLTVGSILFLFVQNIYVLLLYCLLAFSYSGQAAVVPSTVTELFGEKHTGVNYGTASLGMSVGSVLFPLLANYFQSEFARHIIAICASALGIIFILLLKQKTPENGVM